MIERVLAQPDVVEVQKKGGNGLLPTLTLRNNKCLDGTDGNAHASWPDAALAYKEQSRRSR